MIRRSRAALTLALLLALLPGALAETVSELRVEGLVHVNRAAIDAMVNTRQGGNFDPNVVQDDFDRVMDLGFFDVDKSTAEVKRTAKGVELTFKLFENPVITAVGEVRGINIPDINVDQIKAAVAANYKVGEVFNHRSAFPTCRAIEDAYRQAGYEASVPPPLIGDDGAVLVLVHEVTIEDVTLTVIPEDAYANADAIKNWLGIRVGSAFNAKQIQGRADAALGLGFFVNIGASWTPSDTNPYGRIVHFSGLLDERPVPTAEGAALIYPAKVLRDLAIYKVEPLPGGLVLTSPPSDADIAALKAKCDNAPTDAALAGRYALAFARAGNTDAAIAAAQKAIPLLAPGSADPATAVLLARVALITGDAARAFALLDQLRQDAKLPLDGLPALIQADAYLLADQAVAADTAKRIPGDTIAWVVKTLSYAKNRDTIQATPQGTAYSAALGAAWDAFSKLSDDDLASNHEAYERTAGLFSLLASTGAPFSPATIVPACQSFLQSAIAPPVLDDTRLTAALEKKAQDDPAIRLAWAKQIVLREMAASLAGGVAVKTEEPVRKDQLSKAQVALQGLLISDKEAYRGVDFLRALAYIVQGEPIKAQEALAGLIDTPGGSGAEQLYLLAASLGPTDGSTPTDEQMNGMLLAAADRLSPIIADGRPHPGARYARYTLLGAGGKTEDAIREAEAVAKGANPDARAWATIGLLQAKTGKGQEADAALSEAARLDPLDVYASYTLGLVKWVNGGDPVASIPLMQRLMDETAVDVDAREIAF